MKERNHGRAPGMTQTSISLRADFLERIKRMAAADRRATSTMICLILERAVNEMQTRL